MPYTVWGAFDKFRKEIVDLESDVTKQARASRDFLLEQLKAIAQSDPLFPKIIGNHIPFGSFARGTKIRPLDDIDLLLPLNGRSTTLTQSPSDPHTYWLKITDASAPLSLFPDGYGYVNSTKVLNKIRDSLAKIRHYDKAEIRKTMQAVTLSLRSYSWVFDIVPAVPVSNGAVGTAYYLIPDGYGNWIRTNPRIDSEITTKINAGHNGMFLPTMRLLKFWNGRTHKPKLRSYYFEALVNKVFHGRTTITDYPTAIKSFFDYGPIYLNQPCPDPKNLGPYLDASVDPTTKIKVANALAEASTYAGYALMYERQSDSKNAIYWWGKIFGPNFPSYG